MQVLRNPSKAQLAKALQRSGYLRVVKDHGSGDLYFSPGDNALHEEIIRSLGLGERAENLGQVFDVAAALKLYE